MLYDKTQKNCIYGQFDTDNPASYILTNGDKLKSPWYYIMNNRKLLLYLDQNGPVKMQYQPPNGILVFKREIGENQSKWQVWVSSPDLNGGTPVSNFGSPVLNHNLPKPEITVHFTPEKAVYTLKADNATIITELFMAIDAATVSMKTTVVNTSGKDMDFTVSPAVFPYINMPQMVAWDLPEWYLNTSVKGRNGNMFTIHSQMNDPDMNDKKRRSVTYNIDYDDNGEFELNMAEFSNSGNFFAPNTVLENIPLTNKMKCCDSVNFSSFQTVYAAKYKFNLKPNEEKAITQVLTVQKSTTYSEAENLSDGAYFSKEGYEKKVCETKAFYNELFTKRSIKTDNPLYDNFINNFAPLQMYWVSSLDRGWPSSMRGTRDASQDYVGVLPLDAELTRKTIIDMLRHEQTDGWMPRQISTVSRKAPHDMRYFSDGGAFLLELFHEYMTFTRDTSILDEELVWLDSDEKSTLLEHIIRCTQFYLDEKNIGEHKLCKVWYGDWWDVMDKIGMDGRGETVTVTAQMILNFKNLSDMFNWLCDIGKLDESYRELADKYLTYRNMFIKAMKEHAYNNAGFFNGYFNDNGKWLFSDEDPDGESRVYVVSNAWALISGCCNKNVQNSVINQIQSECLGDMGYNLGSKNYTKVVEKAGRVGNGTRAAAAPYNHAQSFLVRALCVCGESNIAYDVTRYILPIEEDYAPAEMTYAPPYCIANSYSNSKDFPHRVELQFLSGTVSYVLRTVYNFFFGITPEYTGLSLKPCVPDAFGDCSVKFTYLGKKFLIYFVKSKNTEKLFMFNGEKLNTTINEISGKPVASISDYEFKDENVITVEY